MKNNATLIQAEALRNARVLDQRKGALGKNQTSPISPSKLYLSLNILACQLMVKPLEVTEFELTI